MPLNYAYLYREALINASRQSEVMKRVEKIYENKPTYMAVEAQSGIPWWCVGAIHSLESDMNFNQHLHNGDPLTHRTVHVPSGRPIADQRLGHLPYEWYESAIDALSLHYHPMVMDPIPECLQYMEAYNGFGYRKHNVYSPYVWGATSLYTSGLYVSDGSFNALAISQGIGGAAILKGLEAQKLVDIKIVQDKND